MWGKGQSKAGPCFVKSEAVIRTIRVTNRRTVVEEYTDWMLIAVGADHVLAKRICRQCKEKLWKENMWASGHGWNHHDDDSWDRRGVVTCPRHRTYYGGTFVAETRAVYMEPPEHCPFMLEHLMAYDAFMERERRRGT